ncbi:hypothetical protein DB345_13720 [Spartobacteria bacterium LR76]|nr:hypothetical protein DB345_13720 [Spartobacteria bacterium LR76]
MFRYSSLPFQQVQINDPFWNERLRVNHEQSLPKQYEMCERTGRFDALKLEWKPGMPNRPHHYWDSDTAKWLEAACYACAIRPDPELRAQIDRVAALFIGAQLSDGYLNAYFTVCDPVRRWKNLKFNHELYCAGHIFEAAVAHHQLTGSRDLLDAACRLADYIDSIFGLGEGKIPGYCGHEEIELALVRLHRATGEKRYLDLAAYFINQRGQKPLWFELETQHLPQDFLPLDQPPAYFQAHVPVREQKEVVGHAVRAMYLYCGMADVARETADPTLLHACETLWKDMEACKVYVTGGIGSTWYGETFTTPYDLPNERAYCETCASVSLIFWAHRMLQHSGERKYADMIERALYNGALSGMSLDGRKFFYQNPLLSFGHHHRSDWFECSCCPSNLSRLLGTLGSYLFSETADELRVHLHIGASASFTLGGRTQGALRQEGSTPWGGAVRCELELPSPLEFTLAIRVPEWAGKVNALRINGDLQPAEIRDGYLRLSRVWQGGDAVELEFPVETRRIVSHAKLAGNAGQIALARGPFVYCIEDHDFEGSVLDVGLPAGQELTESRESLVPEGESLLVLAGRGVMSARSDQEPLYQPATAVHREETPFKAIPYFAWDNRTPGAMRVWIPETGQA